MGNKTLIYRVKVEENLNQSYIHLKRLNNAFIELNKRYIFPINKDSYIKLIANIQDLAFSDQIIYRFSKLQDTIGAKLFKSFLLFQGENIDKPFLDILSELEKMDIVNVDDWFEMRDLRNEIAHEYGEDIQNNPFTINQIYKSIDKIENILDKIEKTLEKQ